MAKEKTVSLNTVDYITLYSFYSVFIDITYFYDHLLNPHNFLCPGMDGSGTNAIEPRSPTTDKPAADTTKSGPQAELLHQVHFMSNPIHLRQVWYFFY